MNETSNSSIIFVGIILVVGVVVVIILIIGSDFVKPFLDPFAASNSCVIVGIGNFVDNISTMVDVVAISPDLSDAG